MNLTDAPAAVADGTPPTLWPATQPPPGDLAGLTLLTDLEEESPSR
jgi:NAD+ kinase